MNCQFCKEDLDERDILENKLLHCWKCGFKRPLTPSEIKIYTHSNYEDDEWVQRISYIYEV